MKHRFAALRSRAEFHSLRYIQCSSEYLSVRRNVDEPSHFSQDRSAMFYVRLNGVEAYTVTNDLSTAGLQAALEQAERQTERIARHALSDIRGPPPANGHSQYCSPNQDAPFLSLAKYYELLAEESIKMSRDECPVNWSVFLEISRQEQLYLSGAGAEQCHEQRFVYPSASVTAYDGHDSQTRGFGSHHTDQQGGAEATGRLGLVDAVSYIADQALQLLAAPNTPSSCCDLLLVPDQMILQIHESTDHLLELDRTLGDEHNYAGTSFIKTENFGHYQYGSSLLNVSFDPEIPEELTSYRQDDDNNPAHKEYLIRGDHLLRPLGDTLSQHRSGLEGVVNSHASSWNRTPIGRMVNLNLEPGGKNFTRLMDGIKRGVLMSYNRSWSIDNTRNKFQFGCEWGQLIEDSELKDVVKNPNYRGISAQFWRNLSVMGNVGTFRVLGTPYCGKGEPNQMIRIGHALPTCIFGDVDVFGGDA